MIDLNIHHTRTWLIEQGWTPPTKAREQAPDEPQVPVVAYQHRMAPDCVTSDPTAYSNPHELVRKQDVLDHVEWLEAGVDEWRAYAVEAARQNVAIKAAVRALCSVYEGKVPPGDFIDNLRQVVR